MKNNIRRQLTLFVDEKNAAGIEQIRAQYNPKQKELIDCHVTLCREDEIEDLEQIINNLTRLNGKAITIRFGHVKRFDNGNGVLLPATVYDQFQKLRQEVLKGLEDSPGQHEPHITLVHPRNATCTDDMYQIIERCSLPAELSFTTISLIEQENQGKWRTLRTFYLHS